MLLTDSTNSSMKTPFPTLRRLGLALLTAAATAWQAQSATVGLNFADGWSAIWLTGKTADGFSGWADSTTTANNTANIAPSGTTTLADGAVTVTWNANNTWAAGSQNNPDQMLYRVYLDDGGNGLVAGDGIGVSVTISGLGAWLAANGSQNYILRCYASTDTGSASFHPVMIRQGAPNPVDEVNQLLNLTVLETVPMPALGAGNFPTTTGGGGTRGYADSGFRTEDTITITIQNGASPIRGTLAGFMIYTVEPTITSQPQAPAGAVYLSTPFSLTVGASGLAPLSYQWMLNASPIAGATTTTYAVASAANADSGSYTVVVTNSVGAVTSAPVVINAIPGTPSVTAEPVGGTRYVGAYLDLGVGIAGSPPFQYQWKRSGVDVPGATSNALLLTNLTPAHAGTYVLHITNAFGTATSAGATLALITPAPGSFRGNDRHQPPGCVLAAQRRPGVWFSRTCPRLRRRT
jgi:hypothetical protein